MNIHIIKTFDEFLSVREEWDDLLKSSASDCIFLTHEWLSVWWRHLSERRRLHIVTVRDADQLIGILPVAERAPQFIRMMPRVLEFIGSGVIGSDYLDVIVRSGHEREALSAIADHLNQRSLMLQLCQLRAERSTTLLLAEQLDDREWIMNETKLNVCPYIDLRGLTWETYVATLGPNLRKNINRYLRNLSKSFDMRFECVQTSDEAGKALEITIDLHHKRWGTRGGESEAFQSQAVVAFHREFVRLAAARGWLRLLVMWLDDVPAAALYGLRYGPTFYFYQSGFDPQYGRHRVGVATMGLAINTAIQEGASEYDFLHGNEEYKFHWAREVRGLTRFELHPPQVMAWIYKQAIDLNRAGRQMAKRVLNIAVNNAAFSR
jgi:CelD/BcsL family acetyltransferase involved in cellulose biosynthesis